MKICRPWTAQKSKSALAARAETETAVDFFLWEWAEVTVHSSLPR